GLRVRFEANFESVTYGNPGGAGESDRFFYYFAIADGAAGQALTLVFTDDTTGHVNLWAQQRDISVGEQHVDLARLLHSVDTTSLAQNALSYELILAHSDLLQEMNEPCTLVDSNSNPIVGGAQVDGAPPGGLLLLLKLTTATRCVPLHDALATSAWLSAVTL